MRRYHVHLLSGKMVVIDAEKWVNKSPDEFYEYYFYVGRDPVLVVPVGNLEYFTSKELSE